MKSEAALSILLSILTHEKFHMDTSLVSINLVIIKSIYQHKFFVGIYIVVIVVIWGEVLKNT